MITLAILYFCLAVGAESDKMMDKLLTKKIQEELQNKVTK